MDEPWTRSARMAETERGTERKAGGGAGGKAALLVGAAGLLLFIVGVKRKHRLHAEREGEAGRRKREGEA